MQGKANYRWMQMQEFIDESLFEQIYSMNNSRQSLQ